jgi:hypothetical protein
MGGQDAGRMDDPGEFRLEMHRLVSSSILHSLQEGDKVVMIFWFRLAIG